jgi:hypothetical protein
MGSGDATQSGSRYRQEFCEHCSRLVRKYASAESNAVNPKSWMRVEDEREQILGSGDQ